MADFKKLAEDGKQIFTGDTTEDKLNGAYGVGRSAIEAGGKAKFGPAVVADKILSAKDKIDEKVTDFTAHPATGAKGRTIDERAGDYFAGISPLDNDAQRAAAKQATVDTTGSGVGAFVANTAAYPITATLGAGDALGESAAAAVTTGRKLLTGDDGVARNGADQGPVAGDGEKVIYVDGKAKVVPATQQGSGLPNASAPPAESSETKSGSSE